MQDLEGASGIFGPVEPLVWQQQQQFGTRQGTTWLSLAAPIAGLARFEGFEGFERFEGFEAFEAFEAFGGSIRQFRASRKRKTWLATAASFAPTWLATASNLAAFWQLWPVSKSLRGLQDLEGASGIFGPVEPLVWQQQQQFGTRQGTTWLSLAAPIAGLARFEGFEGFERFEGFEAFEAFGGSIRQFRASRKKKDLACHGR